MEHHGDIENARSKAHAYIHSLLQSAIGKPSHETASNITALAFHSNPVRELFELSAGSNERPKTTSPAPTLKHKGSRGLLRSLGRRDTNKSGSSDGRAGSSQVPHHDSSVTRGSKKDRGHRTADASTSSNGTAISKAVPMSSCFPASQKANEASRSVQYNCILCRLNLSSKGVCKRHLEDQHVSAKVFQCEKCAKRFAVKAEAKKHCNACGMGVFLYQSVSPNEKKVYACEFTGKCFSSLRRYVDHLLDLSEIYDHSGSRPLPDLKRKLVALLDQPKLKDHVEEISSLAYGSKDVWRKMQWTDFYLSKITEQLEYASVRDNGTIEFGKHVDGYNSVQNLHVFLNSLMVAGCLSPTASCSPPADVTPKMQRSDETPHAPVTCDAGSRSAAPIAARRHTPRAPRTPIELMPPPPLPADPIVTHFSDIKSKRHLSEESRLYVPHRPPPGPPMIVSNYHYPQAGSAQYPQQVASRDTSNTSLPFRPQDIETTILHPSGAGLLRPHIYDARNVQSDLSSDAASESTYISSFQDPELATPTSFDHGLWPTHGNYGDTSFHFHGIVGYGLPGANFSDVSMSTATGQTYVGNYNESDQKLAEFSEMPLPNLGHCGTFLLDDDDSYDFHEMNG